MSTAKIKLLEGRQGLTKIPSHHKAETIYIGTPHFLK
jgi:hypothetical protein